MALITHTVESQGLTRLPCSRARRVRECEPADLHRVVQRAWAVRSWCEEHSAGITFSLVSRDGEEGYPGTVRATAEYRLTDANELVMTFSATTDKATLVNLCNHAYWNLSGGFKARVLDHDLRIAASSIVGVDDTLVPKTGALVEVADTPFDFRSGDLIGRRIYDIGNTPPGHVVSAGVSCVSMT